MTGSAPQLKELYGAVWEAVRSRRPIAAVYHGRRRLFCPHRLGRNKQGRLRVLCYQYGGESNSGLGPVGSPENWRCVALEKLSGVELLNGEWRTAPNHSRPASCITDPDIDAADQPERFRQCGRP